MKRKIEKKYETKNHVFDFDDTELHTEVEIQYEVTHPDYDSWDGPLDYYGCSEVISWRALSVKNSTGVLTCPKHVLTPEQFQEYTLDLIKFIEG